MIVVNSIFGQRSNRFMEIANAMAVAIDRGETLRLTESLEYLRDCECHVGWEGRVIIAKSAFWARVRLWIKRITRVFPGFRIEIPRILTVVSAWTFWHWERVARHADEIRGFFAPIISQEVRDRFEPGKVAGGKDLLLGVHVRRGDYREFMDGKYFFDDETYIQAINECAELTGCSRVFVFSNESLDRQKFISGCKACRLEFPGGSAVEDQWMMGQCDYLIGPPSTFTWWACFAGKGTLLGGVGNGPMRLDGFRDVQKELARY